MTDVELIRQAVEALEPISKAADEIDPDFSYDGLRIRGIGPDLHIQIKDLRRARAVHAALTAALKGRE